MSKDRELTPIEAVGLIPEAANLVANIVAINKGSEKPIIKAAKVLLWAAEFIGIVAEKCDLNKATKGCCWSNKRYSRRHYCHSYDY